MFGQKLAVAQTRIIELEKQLTAVQTTAEFLMARVNVLEHERAALLNRLGVGIVVPEMKVQAKAEEPDPRGLDLLQNIFDDIGDDAARDLGIKTHSLSN